MGKPLFTLTLNNVTKKTFFIRYAATCQAAGIVPIVEPEVTHHLHIIMIDIGAKHICPHTQNNWKIDSLIFLNEFQVLCDGDHSLERCQKVGSYSKTNYACFKFLWVLIRQILDIFWVFKIQRKFFRNFLLIFRWLRKCWRRSTKPSLTITSILRWGLLLQSRSSV